MPRVITAPVDINSVDYYLVKFDGVDQGHIQPEKDATNTRARLAWSLPDNLADGNHTVQVAAGNEWGDTAYTSPFLFAKQLPALPSGIALEF